MSLGQELVAVVLGYARARFDELTAVVLADVTNFANSLGLPPFPDNGNEVANHLTNTKQALSQAAADLAATNLIGAADHLGTAINELDAAAKAAQTAAGAVGTGLEKMLRDEISWAGVAPKGLASQLGLPAKVPDLKIVDGALQYVIEAPGKTLDALVTFKRAVLTARLHIDGKGPALSVNLALDGIELGIGGGIVKSLLGGATGSVSSNIVVGFDSDRGLTLSGGASPRIVLPAQLKSGLIDLREIALELPSVPDTFDLSGTFTADLGGVIKATVEGAGVHLQVDPAQVLAGNNPLTVDVKPPTGIGLAMDAGLVRGGGFLSERDGGFGGALQMRLGPVDVKAVGLLTLKPDFALVVVMSVQFTPPIDLSFGFTLNAVGGVVGIEHCLDTDALRSKISDGALDHIMFPADPVAAAPAILDTLTAVFPVKQGSIVIGPMVELGWGRPVSFLTAQLGVILSLPDPKVVIIGRVRIAVPAPQLPIVDLRATVYGEITPDHLLILVSLRGSRIAGFTIGGDIGLLIRWSGDAEFAVSAGGFHPRFQPPPELTGMERLHMDLSPPAILQLRSESYFAVTTNSIQLGARVEMGADLGVASISGHLQFDALVVFSPHFMFMIDLSIGLTVRALGTTLCGVNIQLHLEGPRPWRAQGNAEVEILWWSVDIDVGPYTWGDDDNPPPAPAHPRLLIFDALDRNPGAWQALSPPDSDQIVRLIPAKPSDTELTVHPLGLFDVRQHVVPLETVVVRVGANPVPEGERRVYFAPPLVNGKAATGLSSVTDLFSAGNFLDLTDDQKMSRPSFEPMMAGARIQPPGSSADPAAARQVELRYETFVCDDESLFKVKSVAEFGTFLAFSTAASLAAGAAGRSELRARQRYATTPDPIVLADPAESVVRSKTTLTAADATTLTYTHAAETYLGSDLQITRVGVG